MTENTSDNLLGHPVTIALMRFDDLVKDQSF